MGINFLIGKNVSNARWSYSGFLLFRKRVADSLGFSLKTDSNGDWIDTGFDKWPKIWLYFLTMNDSEGFISPYRCGKIYPDLEKIIKSWKNSNNETDITLQYHIQHGLFLIESMKFCHENKLKLEVS